MKISVDAYTLTVDEFEVWDIIFAYKAHYIDDRIPHCARVSSKGGQTPLSVLLSEYKQQLRTMDELCHRIGRPEWFKDSIAKFEEKAARAEAELMQNRENNKKAG